VLAKPSEIVRRYCTSPGRHDARAAAATVTRRTHARRCTLMGLRGSKPARRGRPGARGRGTGS